MKLTANTAQSHPLTTVPMEASEPTMGFGDIDHGMLYSQHSGYVLDLFSHHSDVSGACDFTRFYQTLWGQQKGRGPSARLCVAARKKSWYSIKTARPLVGSFLLVQT